MIETALLLSLIGNRQLIQLDSGILHVQEIIGSIHDEQSNDEPEFLAQISPVVRENGLDFELLSCEVIAGASSPLQCEFLIENPTSNPDRTIAIYDNQNTYVIDSRGNSIRASNVDMAGSGKNHADLPSNVPIRATVLFEGVPEDEIRLINLYCYSLAGEVLLYEVQFNF